LKREILRLMHFPMVDNRIDPENEVDLLIQSHKHRYIAL